MYYFKTSHTYMVLHGCYTVVHEKIIVCTAITHQDSEKNDIRKHINSAPPQNSFKHQCVGGWQVFTVLKGHTISMWWWVKDPRIPKRVSRPDCCSVNFFFEIWYMLVVIVIEPNTLFSIKQTSSPSTVRNLVIYNEWKSYIKIGESRRNMKLRIFRTGFSLLSCSKREEASVNKSPQQGKEK